MVERVRTCTFGLEVFGFAPSFTAAVHAGRLEVVEESEASLAMGILQTVVEPYSGETLTAFPAIGCDVAVLHALEADPEGNAALGRHWGVDRELSLIASTVIITAERIVPRLEQADVIAPSVRAVVEAPGAPGRRPVIPSIRWTGWHCCATPMSPRRRTRPRCSPSEAPAGRPAPPSESLTPSLR